MADQEKISVALNTNLSNLAMILGHHRWFGFWFKNDKGNMKHLTYDIETVDLSATIRKRFQDLDSKKFYLVGLMTGGEMGDPDMRVENLVLVLATTPKEAEEIYNIANECIYFYGRCVAELNLEL